MRWLHILVQSQLFISIGAGLLALLTEVELIEETSLAPLVVGFSTLLVYNLLRWIKIKQRKMITNTHNEFALNVKAHVVLVFLAALGLVVSACQLPFYNLTILALGAAPALTYGIRFIPSSHGWLSPREIPFVKLPLVALVWALATVAYPAVQAENLIHPPYNSVLLYGAERFLFILALTIPFDIRDAHLDSLRMRTLPMLVGRRAAAAIAMSLFLILLALRLFLEPNESLAVNLVYCFVYLVSAALLLPLIRSAQPRLSPMYYTGLLDGMLILLPASVLLLRLVSHV